MKVRHIIVPALALCALITAASASYAGGPGFARGCIQKDTCPYSLNLDRAALAQDTQSQASTEALTLADESVYNGTWGNQGYCLYNGECPYDGECPYGANCPYDGECPNYANCPNGGVPARDGTGLQAGAGHHAQGGHHGGRS